jgi:elongation factor G
MGSGARNVAFVGPSGSGKTTLLESCLFVAGAIARKGSVADGTSIGDASPEARERQMSTEVTAARLEHQGVTLTLLDCPGAAEFSYEAHAALMGVDLAVVVVEPLAERMVTAAPILHFLDRHAIPHLVLINKMDRSEQRYRDLLAGLRAVSARPVIPHQYAIGRGEHLVGYIDLVTEEAFGYRRGGPSDRIPLPDAYRDREQAARTELLETLADFDDDLLEALLEERAPSPELILRDLCRTLGADQVVPVLMSVAEGDMGVRRFLETIVREAPLPQARAERLGVAGGGPALAQVLKTWFVPHVGKLSLARIWRGTLKEGAVLGGMKVAGMTTLVGAQQRPVAEAQAGDIVALPRLDAARTGMTLANGGGDSAPTLPAAQVPVPMLAFAVHAQLRTDEVKLSGAFQRLTEEDPSLRVETDPETRETLLWGQGEMHLKVAMDRLRNRFNVAVAGAPPRTPYRETIRRPAGAHGRHKKQSGGHGQFGDVKIEITPLERGAGFRFESRIVGGSVPRQYIPAVEAGARELLQKGPHGFPVVDVGVALLDGQFHTVDSNELSFKMATALALKEGLPRCAPVLLEPVLAVRVSVPADYTARALQLVSGRRGQILGYEAKADWPGWDEVNAHIPQAEIQDMIVSLRSMTLGTGYFEWAFDHFQEVPEKLTAAIVEQHREAAAAR